MSKTLPTLYQQQLHKRHYAKWRDDLERRETWEETVGRYMNHMIYQTQQYGGELTLKERAELRNAILDHRILPSMRAMMTAGKALERDNVAGFNCAYLAIDHPRAFDETLFILCCGTGVGFSVESKNVQQLPPVASSFLETDETIIVGDSKEGWATAFQQLLAHLWKGEIPQVDTSNVRKAGERLKTFGGRASGPEPLENLFAFCIELFQRAAGRQLSETECHEIMCKIGDIVVVGGVRRSALISLYDPTDEKMANIKSGEYWNEKPHLRLANNSAAWTEKPSYDDFLKHQWNPLVEGKSGEPGISNREALKRKAASTGRRDDSYDFGTNPCGEIILRSKQFCNLSEVVARPDDTFEDLIEKVRLATILGTIQSTLTNFRYIRDDWKQNCDEERLLGVSITGVVDNPILNGTKGRDILRGTLHALKHVAIDTNKTWAARLGINQSVSITCIKPAGTTSKLTLTGAGMNEWHSKYFIQRQRGNKVDPASEFLYMSGIPCEDDLMSAHDTHVFSWPIKAPEGALVRDDMSALRKLELWTDYAESWCEHNPSTTINVKEEEWEQTGLYVYEHFDIMAGVAFLPFSDHVYLQAPFEEIDQETYEKLQAQMPESINWDNLSLYETEDMTESAKELACTAGGSCDIDYTRLAA